MANSLRECKKNIKSALSEMELITESMLKSSTVTWSKSRYQAIHKTLTKEYEYLMDRKNVKHRKTSS